MQASDVTGEQAAIAFVLERTGSENGDDAATLRLGAGPACVSTDSTIEGIHAPIGCDPFALGRRAVARALSDLAAQGAVPRAVTCAVHVPRDRWQDAARLMEGVIARATEQGARLVGGDFASVRATELAVVVTVVGVRGSARSGFVMRAGGAAGDLLAVTGTIGASLTVDPGVFAPEPPDRLRAGRALAPLVRAMADVSDGVARDVRHLAEAAGCAARVHLECVPMAAAHLDPLHAIAAGDDYELVAAIAPARFTEATAAVARASDGLGLTAIGALEPGPAGLLVVVDKGAPVEAPTGFVH